MQSKQTKQSADDCEPPSAGLSTVYPLQTNVPTDNRKSAWASHPRTILGLRMKCCNIQSQNCGFETSKYTTIKSGGDADAPGHRHHRGYVAVMQMERRSRSRGSAPLRRHSSDTHPIKLSEAHIGCIRQPRRMKGLPTIEDRRSQAGASPLCGTTTGESWPFCTGRARSNGNCSECWHE